MSKKASLYACCLISGALMLSACGGGGSSGDDADDTTQGNSGSSGGDTSGPATPPAPVPPPVVHIPNGGLGGVVDSSLINRGNISALINNSAGINKVYLYAGNVTPDDIGSGNAEPVATSDVLQGSGQCTWRYLFNSVAAGNYTVAFTSEANNDNPATNDNINFIGTRSITTVDNAANEQHFNANNIIRVGPGRTYLVPSAVSGIVNPGDVIEIDAGTYVDDIEVWRTNNITLRGVGGRAHLRADNIIPFSSGNDQQNGKGIWVTLADNIRIENIEFSGARVPDENGAGIRAEGSNLSICNSYFRDNENGILGEAWGTMLIENSEFNNNGLGEYGRTHNLYIDDGNTLVFRYNYSHHANIGHNLKTRAEENHILYNRLMDESTGNSSYAVDIPNGGLAYLIGNLLQQGPNTDNSSMVTFGVEGYSNINRIFYAINNTMINDYGGGGFFAIQSGASNITIRNNILGGGGSTPSGANVSNNLVSNDPDIVNRAGFNYQLNSTSSARDAGTSLGNGNGYALTPLYEYVHPREHRVRPSNGTIDIGAYELP